MAKRSGSVPRKPRNPADAPSPRWEVGLGAFAAASVDAFMLFDENLNVVGVNPAAERLAEPSRPPTGAPIGKSILDLSPEIKDSLRYDEYLRVMETGEPYYAEVVSHHPELGEKHHSIKAFKVGDGLGLIVSDITERKQAEEALRESEERLRTLFETMAEGVIAIAPHGRIVDANPAAERILGLKRSEIEGRNYIAPEWEVFRPDGTPMPPEEMAGPRAMKEKRPVRDTVMGVKRPDGSVSWLNVSAAPLLDSLGELTGVVGTFGDITERKQAEEALRDSEEKYRGMFENMLDGFAYHRIVLDEAGKPVDYVFLELNNRFEECTGLKRDDIIGRGVTEVIPGIRDADPDLIGIYGKVALTEEPVQFSIYFAPFDKHYSISSYSPREGYFVALFHDITERKRAEEALKQYSETLEEMVEQRTKELRAAQEQLILKEKLATLGQLAGGVGHELRNPLGAIKNAVYYLNMVLEHPDRDVKETLDILDREVATSERIISSLFDFGREKPPSQAKVDLNEVIQAVLSRFDIPGNVEVASQLGEGLPVILADPDQLNQVFGNIILNAVQAMPEGGRLHMKSEESGPDWVAVSFTDTGAGMAAETLLRVFEPLFTTKAKGIGLGLAHSRTLVEGHGGTIDIQSELGRGSTFTVRLPTSRRIATGGVEGGRPEGNDARVDR